jgi:hypothetical protein
MNIEHSLAFLLLLAVSLFFQTAYGSSTISIPLHRRHIRPEPEDFNGTEVSLITIEDAKGRGLVEIDKNVTNYLNLQYYSTLYIGANKKEMTFVYDTGSTYLWVPLQNWSSWPSNNKYTPTSTFVDTTTSDSIQYGSGSVVGTIAIDDVAITSSTRSILTRKLQL